MFRRRPASSAKTCWRKEVQLQLNSRAKRKADGINFMVFKRLPLPQNVKVVYCRGMEPWVIEKLNEEKKKRDRQEAERPRIEIPVEPPRQEPEKKPSGGAIRIEMW